MSAGYNPIPPGFRSTLTYPLKGPFGFSPDSANGPSNLFPS